MRQKALDAHNVLIYARHFPYNVHRKQQRKYKALLGIGGNVGNVVRRFEHLYWYFRRSPLVNILETAPILRNPPFGYVDQEDFYNSLLLVETNLGPKALLRYVLRVERVFGRKRFFKNGPRTLDIDIIFYENRTMETKELTLPHPGWKERSSVLVPLVCMKGKRV